MGTEDQPHEANTVTTAVVSFDLDAEESWRQRAERNPDWQKISIRERGRYGPLIAIPRILRVLEKHGVTATFHVPGKVVEQWPSVIRTIYEAGHELAHHGYTHTGPRDLSKAEQETEVFKGIEVFEETLGERPVGYRNPSGGLSRYTLELLMDEGFRYDSSMKDLDVPYSLLGSNGTIVELPNSYYLDDFAYFGHNMGPTFDFQAGIAPTASVFDTWRREFDAIQQYGGLFMLTLHPQVIGRAGRLQALDNLLGMMVNSDNVCVTDSESLAEHYADGSGETKYDINLEQE